MTDLEMRRYDAAGAAALFDQLVEVYLRVYADSGDPFFGRDRYERQLSNHLRAAGFELVTCVSGGALAGYVYGFPLAEGTRWWHGLLTEVPPEMTMETGRRTFALCEIMTLPDLQGQGIGHALHDELLAGRKEKRATLLAEPDNPAHAVYVRWGWQVIGQLRPSWEGAPTYNALILPLPLGG